MKWYRRITKYLSFIGVLVVCLLSSSLKGQSPSFSQFYANPLYLNPALAGTGGCPRISIQSRLQWPGVGGYIYQTHAVSGDFYFQPSNAGIGFMMTNDRQGLGEMSTITGSAFYNQFINISKDMRLSVGFEFAYAQKRLDWSAITWGDQLVAGVGFVNQSSQQLGVLSTRKLDFSSGLLLEAGNYFVGIAAQHLFEPNMSLQAPAELEKWSRKYTAHLGGKMLVGGYSKRLYIYPNLMYQRQGNYQNILPGIYVSKFHYTVGAWYRIPDGPILTFGMKKEGFQMAYSFDASIGSLGIRALGAHEFSLSFSLPCKENKGKKYRPNVCPSM